MEALRRTSPVPLTLEPMQDNMDGFFSPSSQRIAIRQGMSEIQTVCACIHEMTHAILHNYEKQRMEAAAGDTTQEPPKPKPHQIEEIEAESTSYMVCQYFGIETGANSFGYVASYCKDRELSELRACLNTINKAAGGMIAGIEKHFAEVCKEQGIDLSEQEKETEQTAPAAEEPAEPELAPLTEPDPNLVKMADEAMAAGVDTVWTSGAEFPLSFDTGSDQPSAAFQEALLVLDDTAYLHIQPCDTGWDYTLYDKNTLRQMDGGQLDAPDLPLSTAALQICEMHDLGGQSIQYAPLSMIEILQEADYQQMQVEAAQANDAAPESTMLPDAPEQTLDEYPMPDPMITLDDLEQCGYRDGDMLPVSKERAMELYEKDLTVYAVVDGGSAEMLFDREDFDAQKPDTMYAISREEWEESPEFDALVQDRLNHQAEREQAFLSHEGDCFAIYQVTENDPQRVRFMDMDWLASHNIPVERSNYDLVYTAPLQETGSLDGRLNKLFEQFNFHRPADFHSPSMSVSDIVAVKRDGVLSCHYCDRVGFQEILGFLPDNPLKNAEMTVEDDYGMIDGIINNGPKATVAELEAQARSGQPISLMDLADAVHREERDKRKSVMEQLRQSPKQERKKTAPKKSAEREL